MDKLEKYREVVVDLIKGFTKPNPVYFSGIDIQFVIDKENDHYFLYYVGWDKLERIHDCIFHLDIIDEKIWIQKDSTNVDLSMILVEKKVPKSDIVLGFQAPYKRRFNGFAA